MTRRTVYSCDKCGADYIRSSSSKFGGEVVVTVTRPDGQVIELDLCYECMNRFEFVNGVSKWVEGFGAGSELSIKVIKEDKE